MGRLNTREEQFATLEWAQNVQTIGIRDDRAETVTMAKERMNEPLKTYFALTCLSRSTTAPRELVLAALGEVFRVRVLIEKAAEVIVLEALNVGAKGFLKSSFYGATKKQGVSLRMPLTTCQPTKECGAACYAHDVLDAAPNTVIRGAVNGALARFYEEGDNEDRLWVMAATYPHTRRATEHALRELESLPAGFQRRANIRFAHVGEMAAYPKFANALAKQVRDISEGEVDCVVYTRHSRASELDPELFIVNFTLDRTSMDRRAWMPEWARPTFSAFDGEVSDEVEINFLEHHRWVHMEPKGEGPICPATAPETNIRSCDACKCNLCFTKPDPARSYSLKSKEVVHGH